MQKEAAAVQNILSLASVLDRIDSTHPKGEGETEVASSSVTTLLEIAKSQEIEWVEYVDPNSGKPYYHNFKTGETSWEKPEQFHPYLPTATTGSSNTANYSSAAFFNQGDGRFTVSGSTTYWEQTGRPNDRAGRQLAAFVDLKDLEKNREETRLNKQEAQKKLSKQIDWRQYKEDKKQMKKRKRVEWMLSE